jgi:NTP pyrophosphatase (non-canonical NTP hydrolase)
LSKSLAQLMYETYEGMPFKPGVIEKKEQLRWENLALRVEHFLDRSPVTSLGSVMLFLWFNGEMPGNATSHCMKKYQAITMESWRRVLAVITEYSTRRLKSLAQIQREIGEWATGQFGDNVSKWTGQTLGSLVPLGGVTEEVGELWHPTIYRHQARGFNTEAEYREAIEDGMSDLLIYLCDYASREGISLHEALNKVWQKVSLRTQKAWLADKAAEKARELTKTSSVQQTTVTTNSIAGVDWAKGKDQSAQVVVDETAGQRYARQLKDIEYRDALNDVIGADVKAHPTSHVGMARGSQPSHRDLSLKFLNGVMELHLNSMVELAIRTGGMISDGRLHFPGDPSEIEPTAWWRIHHISTDQTLLVPKTLDRILASRGVIPHISPVDPPLELCQCCQTPVCTANGRTVHVPDRRVNKTFPELPQESRYGKAPEQTGQGFSEWPEDVVDVD